MGKNNKRKHPDLEEILQRPWCYYCERDFDDLKILINHQKAKHFKCERCGRRLNTAGGRFNLYYYPLTTELIKTLGLSVHMTQVHKETLGSIENALPNRAGPDIEIFGMEGIPDDVRTSHEQRVIGQYAQAEAERRASTGNPTSGTAAGAKKPKFESPSDIKKRLAEHKAKKAAEQAAGISSGNTTPMGAGVGNQSPGMDPSSAAFVSHLPTTEFHTLILMIATTSWFARVRSTADAVCSSSRKSVPTAVSSTRPAIPAATKPAPVSSPTFALCTSHATAIPEQSAICANSTIPATAWTRLPIQPSLPEWSTSISAPKRSTTISKRPRLFSQWASSAIPFKHASNAIPTESVPTASNS